jgi:hypothetical protein
VGFCIGVNLNIPSEQENPWCALQMDEESKNITDEARDFWWSLPRGNQFNFLFVSRISYDDIIEIDDVGDNTLKIPTVFVNFKDGHPPYRKDGRIILTSSMGHSGDVPFSKNGHVRLFPEKLRDDEWEKNWFARNGITYSTEKYSLPPPREPMLVPKD